MFHAIMAAIYSVISWILLMWHHVWAFLLPGDGVFLGTSWEWILSIVFLVLTVRAILFPIFVKQIRSQRAMQTLAPKVKALQNEYKGDKATQQQKLMELYRQEKVNPLMGCLPMFLQIPVFLGLFHVLRHLNPITNGGKTLYGWTAEEFDSASTAKLFGAPIAAAFRTPDAVVHAMHGSPVTVKIVAVCLTLLMAFTTFMTSRQMILKTGWSQDPQQKMIQRLTMYFIPGSLLVSPFIYPFPIGVSIYWVTQNLFALGQQRWVLHKYPPPVVPGQPAPVVKPKQPSRISALVRRATGRPELPAVATAATEARAVAPRPGAKPVTPAKRPTSTPPKPATTTAATSTGPSATAKATPAKAGTAAQAAAARAASAKPTTPAKVTPPAKPATPAKTVAPTKPATAAKAATPAKAASPAKAAPPAGSGATPAPRGVPASNANGKAADGAATSGTVSANGASVNGSTPKSSASGSGSANGAKAGINGASAPGGAAPTGASANGGSSPGGQPARQGAARTGGGNRAGTAKKKGGSPRQGGAAKQGAGKRRSG
jgi:YidC/Oxa1 family membrane protein insertase